MKKAKHQIRFADLPRDYAALCRVHLPRPIRDRVDHQNTVEITDAMAGHALSPDQEDYFDLLCSLIEDYDQARLGPAAHKVSGVDALRHLMGEHGMGAADLACVLGVHRTLGAMILRGERQLTLSHVRKLADYFNVSGDLFLPENR